ncbi:MAG: endonuclease V [Candidatus Caldarchaeum sp.]
MTSSSFSKTSLQFFAALQTAVARIAYPREDRLVSVERVCGVDLAYSGERCGAAAVVYSLKDSKVVERVVKTYAEQPAPYIPGFLFLREGPSLLDLLSSVGVGFDVLLVDGHGRAHPRRCGLATLLGFVAGVPSIGVAKSLLVGELQPDENYSKIVEAGEVLGLRRGPAYYSQGFGVSFNDLLRVSELFGDTYPEPLRIADRLSREVLEESS